MLKLYITASHRTYDKSIHLVLNLQINTEQAN